MIRPAPRAHGPASGLGDPSPHGPASLRLGDVFRPERGRCWRASPWSVNGAGPCRTGAGNTGEQLTGFAKALQRSRSARRPVQAAPSWNSGIAVAKLQRSRCVRDRCRHAPIRLARVPARCFNGAGPWDRCRPVQHWEGQQQHEAASREPVRTGPVQARSAQSRRCCLQRFNGAGAGAGGMRLLLIAQVWVLVLRPLWCCQCFFGLRNLPGSGRLLAVLRLCAVAHVWGWGG